VLSARPGNFFALYTLNVADFTSNRQSNEPWAVPGTVAGLAGLSTVGSAS
jgi:hypothetical protein